MNFSEEERDAYEDRLKWLMIEANTLKKAEEKGRVEGKAEGKAELIQMMLKQGKTVQQIVEFTGLSKEEIEKPEESNGRYIKI